MNPHYAAIRNKIAATVVALATTLTVCWAENPPNIVLIMPDDVSYDDFSFYNNQGPRTPNLDSLARESVRLTDFHVSPTCSPTRASVMTGRYNDATGVWHTILGRYFLRADEVTMADVFQANGYRTALISKWHLGDNHPFRPKDRGFDHVVFIKGGGIDQQQNPWGNRDVPPATIFINDEPVPLTDLEDGIPGAYSTDIFTTHAIDFMRQCDAASRPFFACLTYNVAHTPHDWPADAREGADIRTAVIENFDRNVGRVLRFLDDLGLEDNTVLLFLGDNGMSSARYRGGKASHYEGGHRVPCFLRWPQGGCAGTVATAREVFQLTAHIDLLPTLMDLLDLDDVPDRSPKVPIHGRSLRTLLDSDPGNDDPSLAGRILVVDNQRMDDLIRYKEACVMQDEADESGKIRYKWRLMRRSASTPWELYDVVMDAKQATNLVDKPEHAECIRSLESAYENWWQSISARSGEYARPVLGSASEPETCLWAHDWHTEGMVPWNQQMVANTVKNNGFHEVEFARAGRYSFDLRRWPREIAEETTLSSALKTPVREVRGPGSTMGKALSIHSARIRVSSDGKVLANKKQSLDPAADRALFTIDAIPAGPARIETWFYAAGGEELCGAYYIYVSPSQGAVSVGD